MDRELFVEPEILGRITRLRLLPVAERILEVVRSERLPVQCLADTITADWTLASRLLQLANYAPDLTGRLTSITQAINTLGVETIKSLALGLTIFPFESGHGGTAGEGDGQISGGQLWDHGLACAIVAGRIAARAGLSQCQQVFTAGFLHDIGRVLLYQHWRVSFFEALAVAREKNIPPVEAETLALGRNHLEIGQLWADTAELGPMLRAVIGSHHRNFAMLAEVNDEQSRCVAVVQLADLLCEKAELGAACDQAPIREELWQNLGLQSKHGTVEMNYAQSQIESSRKLFGLPEPEKKPFARVRAITASVSTQARSAPRDCGAVIPVKNRVIPFPLRSPSGAAAPADRPRSQKLNLLIVEDHGSLCDMLSLYFMRYGYHVRTASDGKNALAILDNEVIHLVLLDLMLPRIDGFAVLREIRERQEYKHPYVIVVSAGASTKDRNRVLELGANEYMPKPFHLMRLLERIQNVEKYLLS